MNSNLTKNKDSNRYIIQSGYRVFLQNSIYFNTYDNLKFINNKYVITDDGKNIVIYDLFKNFIQELEAESYHSITNNKLFLLTTSGLEIKVRSLQTLKCVQTFKATKFVNFYTNNDYIVSIGDKLSLWSTHTFKHILNFEEREYTNFQDTFLTKNNKYLISKCSTTDQKHIAKWDLSTGNYIDTLISQNKGYKYRTINPMYRSSLYSNASYRFSVKGLCCNDEYIIIDTEANRNCINIETKEINEKNSLPVKCPEDFIKLYHSNYKLSPDKLITIAINKESKLIRINHKSEKVENILEGIDIDSFLFLKDNKTLIASTKSSKLIQIDFRTFQCIKHLDNIYFNLSTQSLGQVSPDSQYLTIEHMGHIASQDLWNIDEQQLIIPDLRKINFIENTDLALFFVNNVPKEYDKNTYWMMVLWEFQIEHKLNVFPKNPKELLALTTLDLQQKFLEYLPGEIGMLSNLSSLKLSDNKLSYIPNEFCNLTNLKELYIDSYKYIIYGYDDWDDDYDDDDDDENIQYLKFTPMQQLWIKTLQDNSCNIKF